MAFKLVLTAAIVIGAVIETSQHAPNIVLDSPSNTLTGYYADGRLAWQGRTSPAAALVSQSDDAVPAIAALLNGGVVIVYPGGDLGSFHSSASLFSSSAAGTLNLQITNAAGQIGSLDLVLPSPGTAALIKHSETWQLPAYNANWAGSNAFGTLSGLQTLHMRRTAEDEMVIAGCFAAGATAPGSAICPLPAGYIPSMAYPVPIGKITGGVVTFAMGYISAGGNLFLNSQLGTSVTASAQYIIPPTAVPLGNIP